MRTYESYSELKALKKVAMFNAGEIAVMQELGLSPVFYGQALVGRDLPHLTYMLCSPDIETHKRNSAAFGMHPVWVRLRTTRSTPTPSRRSPAGSSSQPGFRRSRAADFGASLFRGRLAPAPARAE